MLGVCFQKMGRSASLGWINEEVSGGRCEANKSMRVTLYQETGLSGGLADALDKVGGLSLTLPDSRITRRKNAVAC